MSARHVISVALPFSYGVDMVNSFLRWQWPLAIAAVILMGSLVPMKAVLPAQLVGEITNALHYPSGIVLGLMLVPMIRHSRRLTLVAWGVGVALFGAIELIQPFFGRACTFSDWMQSSAGLSLGLASSLLRKDTPIPFKRLFLMAGTAMLIAFSLPLFNKIQLLEAHEARFPLISDFESEADLRLWRPNKHVELTVESKDGRFASLAEQFPEIAMQNARYARVTYPDNKYPGITYFAAIKDWRGYRKLCFDSRAHRDGESLTLKLSDNTGKGYRKPTWSQTYPNPAQWHTLCIPLQGLQRQDGSAFDFAQVESLIFVGPEKTPAGWFDIDSVRLVR